MDTPTALDNLQTAANAVVGMMTSVVTTIGNTPLLLVGVGVWFVGSGIGLAKRLIGKK